MQGTQLDCNWQDAQRGERDNAGWSGGRVSRSRSQAACPKTLLPIHWLCDCDQVAHPLCASVFHL